MLAVLVVLSVLKSDSDGDWPHKLQVHIGWLLESQNNILSGGLRELKQEQSGLGTQGVIFFSCRLLFSHVRSLQPRGL